MSPPVWWAERQSIQVYQSAVIQGYRSAPGCLSEQKERLLHYFSSTDFDDQEKFEAVKAIYNQTDIQHKTEQQIEIYLQKALDNLEKIEIEDDKRKEPFRNLVRELRQRNK